MKKQNSKRDAILMTATHLFQLQGYHATGLKQIIEESGAPKGSLYYHFPNGKEEIAREAIMRMKELVLEKTREDLCKGESAIESFQLHVNSIANMCDQHGSMEVEGLQISLIASETASTHESLRKACAETFNAWQDLYTKRLEDFGFDADQARELGVTLNALIEGGCMLAVTNKSSYPLRCISNQLEMLLKQ
ncbi:TetR/AcrR family transcriptional regulator [Bacillus sp. B1-b2]|uniref:TetR/AcrR family transcriptional regulator n=1 Tax=Bacillus sp. B1-b2 TaxID=2653201 RepID=UPI0012629452|nr:TetR/AcrR family transcriptional regulator [Bacillus sp. B1-b2]KAB7668415.1 TetR/AcrR family transcriptional regulator [Bacillus sp. B1-b2]